MDDYYILCPTRPEQPTLISHLISRDICAKRQSENYHKCPNCVLSRIWRDANPESAEATSASAPPSRG